MQNYNHYVDQNHSESTVDITPTDQEDKTLVTSILDLKKNMAVNRDGLPINSRIIYVANNSLYAVVCKDGYIYKGKLYTNLGLLTKAVTGYTVNTNVLSLWVDKTGLTLKEMLYKNIEDAKSDFI